MSERNGCQPGVACWIATTHADPEGLPMPGRKENPEREEQQRMRTYIRSRRRKAVPGSGVKNYIPDVTIRKIGFI